MSPRDGFVGPMHESGSSLFEDLKKRWVAGEPEEIHGFIRNDHSVPGPSDSDVANTKGKRLSLLTTWWPEIVSLAIAMTALFAIMIVMIKYNMKEQPDWKHAINLTTMVAILSTLLRACVALVVEEGKSLVYNLAKKLANAP